MALYNYQTDYSKINPSLFNEQSRLIKARKILTVIKDFSQNSLNKCNCLEVGCSTGVNTNYLAEFIAELYGIDIDVQAVKYGSLQRMKNVCFIVGDAMKLPYRDNFFDIIICNHVYEHVPDSTKMVEEIFRVLKPGGFCYFAAGNKYSIIEGHYKLPFLSWVPKIIANKYLQFSRKGTMYYENHLSYFQLKKIVKKFSVVDYTLKIIQQPEMFEAQDMIRPDSMICKIPGFLLNGAYFLIPTYIFILSKPNNAEIKSNECNY